VKTHEYPKTHMFKRYWRCYN